MKALRIFVVILAGAVMLSGGSTTARAGDPTTDTCAVDGNIDTANTNCIPSVDSQTDVAGPDANSNSDDTNNYTDNTNTDTNNAD